MKFENGYNKLGWNINDEKPPAEPCCFEKKKLGDCQWDSLDEFFLEKHRFGTVSVTLAESEWCAAASGLNPPRLPRAPLPQARQDSWLHFVSRSGCVQI